MVKASPNHTQRGGKLHTRSTQTRWLTCSNFVSALASTAPWWALDKGAEILRLAEVRSAMSCGMAAGRVTEALWCMDQGRGWGCGGWDLLGAHVLLVRPGSGEEGRGRVVGTSIQSFAQGHASVTGSMGGNTHRGRIRNQGLQVAHR